MAHLTDHDFGLLRNTDERFRCHRQPGGNTIEGIHSWGRCKDRSGWTANIILEQVDVTDGGDEVRYYRRVTAFASRGMPAREVV